MVENRALRGVLGPAAGRKSSTFLQLAPVFSTGAAPSVENFPGKEKGPPRGLLLGRFPRE